jgi:hypothetical protein
MNQQTTHAEATVYHAKATIADIPSLPSLADSLRNFGTFTKPPEVELNGRKHTKDKKYCKACFTHHPREMFVLADKTEHKNYCRQEAERVALKKERIRERKMPKRNHHNDLLCCQEELARAVRLAREQAILHEIEVEELKRKRVSPRLAELHKYLSEAYADSGVPLEFAAWVKLHTGVYELGCIEYLKLLIGHGGVK